MNPLALAPKKRESVSANSFSLHSEDISPPSSHTNFIFEKLSTSELLRHLLDARFYEDGDAPEDIEEITKCSSESSQEAEIQSMTKLTFSTNIDESTGKTRDSFLSLRRRDSDFSSNTSCIKDGSMDSEKSSEINDQSDLFAKEVQSQGGALAEDEESSCSLDFILRLQSPFNAEKEFKKEFSDISGSRQCSEFTRFSETLTGSEESTAFLTVAGTSDGKTINDFGKCAENAANDVENVSENVVDEMVLVPAGK